MAEYRVADLAHPRATEQHVDCPECLALEPFAVGMAKAMGTVSHTYQERVDGETHGVTVTREPQTPEPAPVHYTPQGLIPPGHEHTYDMTRVTCVPCIDGEPYQRALAAVAEEYGDPLPEAARTSSLLGNDSCAACLTPVGAAHADGCPLALL